MYLYHFSILSWLRKLKSFLLENKDLYRSSKDDRLINKAIFNSYIEHVFRTKPPFAIIMKLFVFLTGVSLRSVKCWLGYMGRVGIGSHHLDGRQVLLQGINVMAVVRLHRQNGMMSHIYMIMHEYIYIYIIYIYMLGYFSNILNINICILSLCWKDKDYNLMIYQLWVFCLYRSPTPKSLGHKGTWTTHSLTLGSFLTLHYIMEIF